MTSCVAAIIDIGVTDPFHFFELIICRRKYYQFFFYAIEFPLSAYKYIFIPMKLVVQVAGIKISLGVGYQSS